MSVEELAALPLFQKVSRMQLAQGMIGFTACDLGAGEVLIREGEQDPSMVLVLAGELAVCVGPDLIEVGRVGAGDTVGELALFGAMKERAATVLSVKPCRLLVMDQAALEYLQSSESPMIPPLREHAARMAIARVRDTQRLVASVAPGCDLPDAPRKGLFARLMGRAGPQSPPPPLVDVMRKSGVFSTDRLLQFSQELESIGELVPLAGGERIVTFGQDSAGPLLLLSGRLDLWHPARSGGHLRLTRLRPGALCCLGAEVDGQPSASDVIAVDPAWVLRLPASIRGQLQARDRHLAKLWRLALFNGLCNGLRQANATVESNRGSLEALRLNR
ncbi:MAG: CRP-like cAMP-binding protein [Cognaticolwellia sp.]